MNERDRIEHLMNIYMLTPSQFADRTGIQRASVSHILSNRNKPSLEVIHKIYNAFPEVDVAWLFMGKGEPPCNPDITNVESSEAEPAVLEDGVRQPVPTTLFPSLMEAEGEMAPAPAKPVREKVAPQQSVVQDVNNVSEPAAVVVNGVANAEETRAVVDVSLKKDVAKRIKEIKIFYDNGTYETFVPEKK